MKALTKKINRILLAVMVAFAGHAFAGDTIQLDLDGPGGAFTSQAVDAFDVFPGNALSLSGVPAQPGATSVLHYAAEVTALLSTAGNTVLPIGAAGPYELTAVLVLEEQVNTTIDLNGSGFDNVLVLDNLEGGSFKLYYDDFSAGANANDVTGNSGAGYDDGTLILEGFISARTAASSFTISPDNEGVITPLDQFGGDGLGVQTLIGQGDAVIEVVVTFAHPDWFTVPPLVIALDLDTTLSTPFDAINPSTAVSGNVPDYGADGVNGLSATGAPEDFHLEADGNISFLVSDVAALGDRVWEDLDADGIQDCQDTNGNGIIGDAGDTGPECDKGIPGVSVILVTNQDGDLGCDSGDEVDGPSTTTDADGFYEFLNLDPDVEYCVRFDQTTANDQLLCDTQIINPGVGAVFSPANQGGDDTQDSDADTTTGQTQNISLNPGDFDRSWDAGLYCPAKIGDRLTNDANRNGIQDDPEPAGIEGQTVELLECIGNVPGGVIDTRVTDNTGMYMFNPLPPGEYAVRFTKPDDYVFSDQNQGGDEALDCDANVNGLTECVTLGPNEYNPDVDACINQPPAGLGDFVWEDSNVDGMQDPGEPGIPGVTVNLLRPGPDNICNTVDDIAVPGPDGTTVTAGDGAYRFENLDSGRYCVKFEIASLPDDFCTDPSLGFALGAPKFTLPNQVLDDEDSDADPATGKTGNIDLDPGEFDPTNDAGIYCPAKIGDRVWNDDNENGIQEGGEDGVSDVEVRLFECGPDGIAGTADDVDTGQSRLTDNTDGMYMFGGEPGVFDLPPGEYYVQFIKPFGYEITVPDQGDDALDSDCRIADGVTSCISVGSRDVDLTRDCGVFIPKEPGIDIEKATNGVDADDPNAGDAPQVNPGDPVTWVYVVTNTGNVTLTNVTVTDDQGVAVDCPTSILLPQASMDCTASGLAEDLESTTFTVVPGLCGSIPQSPLYENKGMATGEWAPGEFVEDEDPSHYCNPPQEDLGCRFTGGLNDIFPDPDGDNRYTAGGQVGANTGQQPQPKGEWTHSQHEGPAGDFTFHGGTSSAPEGTEIDAIRCSDPGGCGPSGNPPSPVKQLDFDGIGTFKNLGKKNGMVPDFVTAGATVTAEGNGNKNFDGTFHWFEVNIDDLGEPGNTNPKKNPGDADTDMCPLIGFGEKGATELAECSCSDFYRITIYDGVDAANVVKNPDGSIDPSQMNRTDVIYEVWGYIDGGNLQLHHPTGFDRK